MSQDGGESQDGPQTGGGNQPTSPRGPSAWRSRGQEGYAIAYDLISGDLPLHTRGEEEDKGQAGVRQIRAASRRAGLN